MGITNNATELKIGFLAFVWTNWCALCGGQCCENSNSTGFAKGRYYQSRGMINTLPTVKGVVTKREAHLQLHEFSIFCSFIL